MPINPQSHRRTVLRGAAWTAPAIVLATAAPAAAMSGGEARVTTRITPTMDDAGHNLRVSMQFDNSAPGSTGVTTIYVTCLPNPGSGVVDPTPPTGVSTGWVAGTPTPTGNGQVFPFTSAEGIRGIPGGVAATFLFFEVKVGPDSVFGSSGSISTTSQSESGTIADGFAPWT